MPLMWACGSGPDVDRCPEGYQALPDLENCYRGEVAVASWVNARAACEAEGGFLAIPDGGYEALAISTVVNNLVPAAAAWVGLSDLEAEDVWVTVLGQEATFLPWGALEPDGGTNQNCARLNNDAVLLDDTCTEMHEFACEITR
jgi:hypothetical protein